MSGRRWLWAWPCGYAPRISIGFDQWAGFSHGTPGRVRSSKLAADGHAGREDRLFGPIRDAAKDVPARLAGLLDGDAYADARIAPGSLAHEGHTHVLCEGHGGDPGDGRQDGRQHRDSVPRDQAAVADQLSRAAGDTSQHRQRVAGQHDLDKSVWDVAFLEGEQLRRHSKRVQETGLRI